MTASTKSRTRRAEIRRHRPDARQPGLNSFRESGALASVGVAIGFAVVASSILMLRQGVVPYRPGQWIPHDIVSRVDFTYKDQDLLDQRRREARSDEPRIYKNTGDAWGQLEKDLQGLPDKVANAPLRAGLPPLIANALDGGAITKLQQYAQPPNRDSWLKKVSAYVQALRDFRVKRGDERWELFVLPATEVSKDIQARKKILIDGKGSIDASMTFMADTPEFRALLDTFAADNFMVSLQPQIVDITVAMLQPTHRLDDRATAEAVNAAAFRIRPEDAEIKYPANSILVSRDKRPQQFDDGDWRLLQAENDEFLNRLGDLGWKSKLGLIGTVLVVTAVMASYVATYQPRVVKNHARGIAIAGLLLAMLLLAQIAGIGSGPLFLFGIAPTLLTAMILTIGYDQRFAIGIASLHGLLVTVALNQGVPFFLIIWVGVMTSCFLLDDIRSRSKLIEVGGVCALAMMVATAAAGALSLDPAGFILKNCLYTGAAGLAVGFVVLGILPFVEKTFRITTSMTLLELADVSQPLLRRLATEAPGTHSHSLQVATLAEAAAEAVGANSLLCRVGSYYHDIGKINKPDYFIENQQNGENRHLNLSPSVSLLIIIGHVKDGVELAKEYNLPTSILPFIQQHHGSTLVEFFYHRACCQQNENEPGGPAVPESQYRYPGPRPRSIETAIVMIADAVESAARSMTEPTAGRVENLIHELALKRLLDGQFDDCDLTTKDLDRIERAMMKTLLGIYHGRIAYPSMSSVTAPTSALPSSASSVRSA